MELLVVPPLKLLLAVWTDHSLHLLRVCRVAAIPLPAWAVVLVLAVGGQALLVFRLEETVGLK